MPPQKQNAPAPAVAQQGEHNPYLAGLVEQGKSAEEAIQGWFETRRNLRDQARGVVKTGLCSKEQTDAVEALWPTPKRGEKEKDETANGDTAAK